MYMNLVVIAMILFIAYIWATQGLFSAFVHFVCTLAAGAIAFGVWEPLVLGLLMGVREDVSWGVGLIGVFLVSLVALRLAADRLVPSNLDFDDLTNFVGGAVFGVGSGVVTAGIFVIGVGFLSAPAGFLGYQPIAFGPRGALERQQSLWVPADMLTARLYETLSVAGFDASNPMAVYQPDVHQQAALIRITFDDKSRTTVAPEDFKVVGRYLVTADRPDELLTDTFNLTDEGEPVRPQVRTLSGETPGGGARLVGYVVEFGPGAQEASGQVIVRPSQVRLVCELPSGAEGYHPVAVVTQASGESVQAGRFLFDDPEPVVASAGARTDTRMAFEFVVPADAEPVSLQVKNTRVLTSRTPTLPAMPEAGFTPQTRDDAIRSLALLGIAGDSLADLDASEAATVNMAAGRGTDTGVRVSERLPQTLNKQALRAFEYNADNDIISGRQVLNKDAVGASAPRQLQVNGLSTLPGTRLVQIDVGLDRAQSIFGRSVQLASDLVPPVLYDANGQRYQAVGWWYEDAQRIDLRYTPGEPVRALEEIPRLSRNKPDQSLYLIFRVSRGVEIQTLALGSRVVAEFSPPIEI